METGTMTIKQLCDYLQIGANTAYELVNSKGFPTLRLGRKILIPVEQLNEWIKNKTKCES